MSDSKTDKLLEDVRREIQAMDQVDETGRRLLQELDGDIQAALNRSSGKTGREAPTLERMRRAIEYFEVSHPALTSMLSELSAILNNAGI